VAGGWWLVAGGWWLVAGGWWLVAGVLRPASSEVLRGAGLTFCLVRVEDLVAR
jgi:hypothetical protein